YLAYAGRLHGIAKSALPAAVERAVELCQLGDVANKMIARLSKGFKQRVGLAQALIHQPDLLILDEPSSGLDPLQMISMRELLKSLAADCGILLSTHSLPEVTALCQRVAVIHQGKLIHEENLQGADGEHFSRHYLRLAQTVTADDLLSLDSISAAEAPDATSWQISVPDSRQAQVVAEIVARGWQVLEYSHARNFLEERFAALTVGKDASFGNVA
ncbi:MAG: ABC transporter ATP-binding protein, partial [Gammaproteobacteria bacterium]|nr:ABC transporter ATP-binding protein [Gammaproteobacteria bacterium]